MPWFNLEGERNPIVSGFPELTFGMNQVALKEVGDTASYGKPILSRIQRKGYQDAPATVLGRREDQQVLVAKKFPENVELQLEPDNRGRQPVINFVA